MGLRDPDHGAVYEWLRAAESGDFAKDRGPADLPYGNMAGGGYYGSPWWGDGRGMLWTGLTLPGLKADADRKAGDLWKCSVVAACLGWMVDNFYQARIGVATEDAQGHEVPLVRHPLTQVLRHPSPYRPRRYSARALWSATILAFKVYGNAYWSKIRAGGPGGPVIGVRWIPNWQIRPAWPSGQVSDTFISGYVYRVGEFAKLIPPEDIVHFKDGIDPDNERMGLRRMNGCLRSVVTVNAADTYTMSLLENMGIPPVIFSGADGSPLEPAQAQAVLEGYHDATAGENAGRAWATKLPVSAQVMGLSPQEMALDSILDRPVSQICAILRLSPMVVGFPDDQRTFANAGEARKAAWEDCLEPLQEILADELDDQLLPDLGDEMAEFVVWDRTKVRALQEGADIRTSRASVMVAGVPFATVNEARQVVGLPPQDGPEFDTIEPPASAAGGDEGPSGDPEPEGDDGTGDEDGSD